MRSAIALIAAAAAPLASAALLTSKEGGALILNYCSKDIPMRNVPAQGLNVENGVQVDKTLTSGSGRYFTPWITLNVNGGWSMKLNTIGSWDKIMQLEYTVVGKQSWYDMSLVDGKNKDDKDTDPFVDFYLDAGDGVKRTNYYRYDTDDANGMQPPVPTSATVTLVLCPKSAGAAAPTAAPSSAAPTTTTAAPAVTTTTEAPAYTPSSTKTTFSTLPSGGANKNAVSSPAVLAAPSSTEDVEVVTEYATQIVTAIVTETAHVKSKRHAHRHPHGHKH